MIGRTVSHYRIESVLGQGGMGVVYRAEDERLQVVRALKFLHPEAVGDPVLRARLLREARRAARLVHPAIVRVIEVDEFEGRPFLAMEYVEGPSLRQRLEEGPLTVGEAVMVAIQVAEGLAAAHAEGVVHRDLKPGNVVCGRDGQVRIVDFGLARARDDTALTARGAVVGTVPYMAPEQIAGGKVDHRCDLWALGVILFEMVSGRLPFGGAERASLAEAIRGRPPLSLERLCPGVPPELHRIVERALAKAPSQRYDSAAAMLRDLRAVRRRLQSAAGASTVEAPPPRRSRWRSPPRPLLVTLTVLAIGAAGLAWLTRRALPPEGAIGLPGLQRRLTWEPAWEGDPALSPDGGRVAYASEEGGDPDIWIVSVGGGERLQLTRDPARDGSPAWLPAGDEVLFESERGGGRGIWRVGQLGGGATLVVADGGEPAVSPDGSRLAFTRADGSGHLRIAVAPLADPAAARLLTGPDDGLWDHTSPAWSPDGALICYADQHDLWLVPADGGPARRLTADGLNDRHPVWSTAGDQVYFSSQRDGTLAIWAVAATGGEPRRLTMGTGPESQPTVAADGSRLAYSTQRVVARPRLHDLVSGEDIDLPALEGAEMATLAPDGGAVAFVSYRWSRTGAIWRQDLRQGRPIGRPVRLVQPPGAAAQPRYSPDGGRLAYYVIEDDQRDIWVLDTAGGQAHRVTRGPAQDIYPCWSPDGRRLAFVSDRGGRAALWVVDPDDEGHGEPPHALTDGRPAAHAPDWSPDGAWIAFIGHEDSGNEVWLLAADGGGPPRRLTAGANAQRLCWRPDGEEIWVLGGWGGRQYTVRAVAPATGATHPIDGLDLRWPREGLALFEISPSGRFLLCAAAGLSGDVWIWEAEPGTF